MTDPGSSSTQSRGRAQVMRRPQSHAGLADLCYVLVTA